jgi:penicillin amidase
MSDLETTGPTHLSSASPASRRRKRGWLRIVLCSAGGLFLLLLLAAGAGVLGLRSAAKAALPVLDGDVHLNAAGQPGIAATVTVQRDGHGVPHIEAASQEDLFVAQGYVTAQDRLWQMDAYRRNANGELAEIMGPTLVKHDRAQRVLQFRNTAQRIYDNLPAEDRARFDAYARGVNLFIDSHQDSLPSEFRLMMYKPKPWKGVDSVSVGMMMVDMLDTHWDVKLGRERIAAKLNNPKLEADLYPVGSWRDHPPTGAVVDLSQPQPVPSSKEDDDDEDDDPSQARMTMPSRAKARIDFANSMRGVKPPPPSVNDVSGAREDIRSLRAALGLPECEGCAAGSNNWVISGAHTASGKPLLSNDMHLGLNVPNIWYMAELAAPGYHVAGVTLPGVPFVIAGHNEHVAWGFTALYADVQDLYIEKLDGKGNFQDLDGQWKPLKVDHELIKVRFGKDVAVDVQFTAHGPLLNPMLTKETRPISLKWTLYDPSLNSLPIYQINTAANWTEFSGAISTWCFPTQNVVYSDDQGHIAYHAVGKLPVRPAGLQDKLVQDGGHEWQGYLPFDQIPNEVDPPSGFLATANARVSSEKFSAKLTDEWAEPYRAERIYKALQGRDHLTAQDMIAVQTDVYSEVDQELAHRFAYAIDQTPGVDDRLKKAADLMRSWDGKLTTDSVAASIVAHARYALWPLLLEPKLGKDADEYRWSESNFAEEEIVMHSNPDWLPPGYKNWDALLTDAVRKGMEKGKAPSDLTAWSYGSWHVVDLEHPLAGYLPLVGRVAGTGELPQSGDSLTVKQVGRAFGPSQRFTMDWSNVDGATENIVLGESGNPFSEYFRDQWKDWYGGTTFALPFTKAAVEAQTRHTLRLVP